jgi:hypothetical protein
VRHSPLLAIAFSAAACASRPHSALEVATALRRAECDVGPVAARTEKVEGTDVIVVEACGTKRAYRCSPNLSWHESTWPRRSYATSETVCSEYCPLVVQLWLSERDEYKRTLAALEAVPEHLRYMYPKITSDWPRPPKPLPEVCQ